MKRILLFFVVFSLFACSINRRAEPVTITPKGAVINTTMLQAALFDIDGTLLDSMPAWNHLAEDYLTARGIVPQEGLYKIVAKMSLSEGAAYLKEQYNLEETTEELQKEIISTIGDKYRYTIPFKDGAGTFLKNMKAKGVKMAVVTASDKESVLAALKRLDVYDMFDFVLTCDEIGVGKTSPLVYQLAAQRLGAQPGQTLVFEDAAYAVKTAHGAGFIVIAIADEQAYKDKTEILNNSVEYIKSYKELKLK